MTSVQSPLGERAIFWLEDSIETAIPVFTPTAA